MRQPSGWLLAIAVALFVGAVVAWVVSGPHRTVVHDRSRPGPTTVLVAPPQTPLPRDSGPKNNAQAKKTMTRRSGSSQAPAATSRPNVTSRPGPQKRAPVKTRKTPRPKAKAPASPPPRPSTSPQTTTPAPAPHDPTVTATAPLPVGVCIRDVARLNHC